MHTFLYDEHVDGNANPAFNGHCSNCQSQSAAAIAQEPELLKLLSVPQKLPAPYRQVEVGAEADEEVLVDVAKVELELDAWLAEVTAKVVSAAVLAEIRLLLATEVSLTLVREVSMTLDKVCSGYVVGFELELDTTPDDATLVAPTLLTTEEVLEFELTCKPAVPFARRYQFSSGSLRQVPTGTPFQPFAWMSP